MSICSPTTVALVKALDGDEPFLITALVRGTDTLLASPTIGHVRYGRDDIRRDHEFVDMLITRDDMMLLEMDRLHDTRPLAGSKS